MKQRGLGKGLSALLSDAMIDEDVPLIRNIPIVDIEPNKSQPRKVFNEANIQELSESILTHGIIQPIIVQVDSIKYTIIAGEHSVDRKSVV